MIIVLWIANACKRPQTLLRPRGPIRQFIDRYMKRLYIEQNNKGLHMYMHTGAICNLIRKRRYIRWVAGEPIQWCPLGWLTIFSIECFNYDKYIERLYIEQNNKGLHMYMHTFANNTHVAPIYYIEKIHICTERILDNNESLKWKHVPLWNRGDWHIQKQDLICAVIVGNEEITLSLGLWGALAG